MAFSRFFGKPLGSRLACALARVLMMCAVICGARGAANANDVTVEVVYPGPDAHIPYVVKSFIFGSTTLSGATVDVNGRRAYVTSSGAWIAYVPFEPGHFTLHVVARAGRMSATKDRDVVVDEPPATLPATPASIDSSVAIEPATDVSVRRGERIAVALKATPNARVSVALGAIVHAVLRERSRPRFEPGSTAVLLAKQRGAGPLIGGYYAGSIAVPADAPAGRYVLSFEVIGPDGSRARANAHGGAYVDASPEPQTASILPFDLGEDGIRRYGVVEKSPDGEFSFFPPLGSRFRIVGQAGAFARVALGDTARGWIARRTLAADGPWNGVRAFLRSIERRPSADGTNLILHLSARCGVRVDDVAAAAGPAFAIELYDASSSLPAARDDRAGVVHVVLSAGQRALWGYRTAWNGNDLVIDVKRLPRLSSDPAAQLGGLTIAIDPGHEPDPGSTGPLGTREADLNLAISQRLASVLRSRGARVVLTRGREGAPLYSRPATAAAAHADLLVSVHGNALPDGVDPFQHHGYSTYWVRQQGRPLAAALHDALRRAIPIQDAGMFEDDLVLTRATEQPSALVENAFVMWPDEEAMLRDPTWQQRFAVALADGVTNFVKAALT